MKWKAWKQLGWMEKMELITATQAIPAAAPNPDTQIPHWKTDTSNGGEIRDCSGAEVFTPNENLGQQRPA